MFDFYLDFRRVSRILRLESIFRYLFIVFNDSLFIRLFIFFRLRLAWFLESGFFFLFVLRSKLFFEFFWVRSWFFIVFNFLFIVESLFWLVLILEFVIELLFLSFIELLCIFYVLFTYGVFCEIVFFFLIFLILIIYKYSKIIWYCNLIEKCDVFLVKNNFNN